MCTGCTFRRVPTRSHQPGRDDLGVERPAQNSADATGTAGLACRPAPSPPGSLRAVVCSEHELSPTQTFFRLNRHAFNPNYVPITMKLNSGSRWTLVNTNTECHTLHIHQNPFQVVSIAGRCLPLPRDLPRGLRHDDGRTSPPQPRTACSVHGCGARPGGQLERVRSAGGPAPVPSPRCEAACRGCLDSGRCPCTSSRVCVSGT